MNVSFARAIAWFLTDWPRRAAELDQLLSGQSIDLPWEEMHGSHRCHHGLCINPNHILWDPKFTNFEKNGCYTAAQKLRQYQHLPAECNKHDPPCLLQVRMHHCLESMSRILTPHSMQL